MFSSGAKDKAEEFEGGRTAPDIVSFALEKLAENVPAPDIVEVLLLLKFLLHYVLSFP